MIADEVESFVKGKYNDVDITYQVPTSCQRQNILVESPV